jgi:hypothetical protein
VTADRHLLVAGKLHHLRHSESRIQPAIETLADRAARHLRAAPRSCLLHREDDVVPLAGGDPLRERARRRTGEDPSVDIELAIVTGAPDQRVAGTNWTVQPSWVHFAVEGAQVPTGLEDEHLPGSPTGR